MGLAAGALAAGPEVRSLLPAGGQRGTAVTVTATGNFANWPVQAWVDRPGLSVAPGGDKGKLQVTSAPDAVGGLYWIRLYDAQGAAAPRPFVLGTLPEIMEQEPNNSPSKAQRVGSAAVVVNGCFDKGGDVDLFAVTLARGQTLVASLAGHETLGSPMDSVLEIVSPRGHVLAYNHDQRGLDPRIEFTAPADGEYAVRAFAFPSKPNSTIGFAGGDQYVYRLTLTTAAFVDYPWPLAVTRGRATRVELSGWNLSDALRAVSVQTQAETAEIFDSQMAEVVPLAVEPHATLVELEPNGPGMPQSVELPSTVSGRVEAPGDIDAFAFEARKGEPVVLQVDSRALGFPLDGVLEVTDAAGKSLARADDAAGGRDPALTFSPPADGRYVAVVSDLNGQGSARHVYRLRAVKAEGDFDITADAEAYFVTPGKPTDITLSIARHNGFAEEIALTVTGLSGPVTAAAARSTAEGESSKTVKLTLSAGGGPFSGPIRVVGRSSGPSPRERLAGAALAVRGARTSDLWLTVVPKE